LKVVSLLFAPQFPEECFRYLRKTAAYFPEAKVSFAVQLFGIQLFSFVTSGGGEKSETGSF